MRVRSALLWASLPLVGLLLSMVIWMLVCGVPIYDGDITGLFWGEAP